MGTDRHLLKLLVRIPWGIQSPWFYSGLQFGLGGRQGAQLLPPGAGGRCSPSSEPRAQNPWQRWLRACVGSGWGKGTEPFVPVLRAADLTHGDWTFQITITDSPTSILDFKNDRGWDHCRHADLKLAQVWLGHQHFASPCDSPRPPGSRTSTLHLLAGPQSTARPLRAEVRFAAEGPGLSHIAGSAAAGLALVPQQPGQTRAGGILPRPQPLMSAFAQWTAW